MIIFLIYRQQNVKTLTIRGIFYGKECGRTVLFVSGCQFSERVGEHEIKGYLGTCYDGVACSPV